MPPHKADQSLDLAFIITLAGAAELVLKQAQSKDPRPVAQYLCPNSTFGASFVYRTGSTAARRRSTRKPRRAPCFTLAQNASATSPG